MSNENLIVFKDPVSEAGQTLAPLASSTEVRLGIEIWQFDSTVSTGKGVLLYNISDYNITTSSGEQILQVNNSESSGEPDERNTTFPTNLETIYAIIGRESKIRIRNELFGFNNSYHFAVRLWLSQAVGNTTFSQYDGTTLIAGPVPNIGDSFELYQIGSISSTNTPGPEYYPPSDKPAIDYTGVGLSLGVDAFDTDLASPYYYFSLLYNLCLHSETPVMLEGGESKLVKDLQRGDMIMTDEGAQPLAKLIKSRCEKTEFVKVSQGAFGENVPSTDLYLTPDHPIGLFKEKTELGNVYKHLSLKELANNMKGINYEVKETDNVYNLVFDEQYAVNVGGIKVLSHHPNHENGKYKLDESEEMNHENRSKLTYVDFNRKYFNFITFKQLMALKPEDTKGSVHVRNAVKFE